MAALSPIALQNTLDTVAEIPDRGIDLGAAVFLRHHGVAEVADIGEAHHGVEALLDHIDDPIAEIEIQYYLGIGPHERDESRHHQVAGQWQADTQCTARGLLRLRQFKLSRFDFRKDAPAAFEE